ncbi:hypothetical protein BDF22DRAFT_206581 [Syncephalis plumigaleata]|nr:hypothetical protein BDF22DRAFT_206581 [Syncephalis plumigaleata]
MLTSLINLVDGFIDGTPLLLLLSLRYIWPSTLDVIFMDSAKARDPALATILEARPYTYHYWREFRHYLRRSLQRLRWLIPYKLAALIPFVGPFIIMALGSRQLARELLEPFFCRMDMDGRMRREWFRHRNAATFGFGVIAYILMQHNWSNLIVYIIAQAAIIELVSADKTLSRETKQN